MENFLIQFSVGFKFKDLPAGNTYVFLVYQTF